MAKEAAGERGDFGECGIKTLPRMISAGVCVEERGSEAQLNHHSHPHCPLEY